MLYSIIGGKHDGQDARERDDVDPGIIITRDGEQYIMISFSEPKWGMVYIFIPRGWDQALARKE